MLKDQFDSYFGLSDTIHSSQAVRVNENGHILGDVQVTSGIDATFICTVSSEEEVEFIAYNESVVQVGNSAPTRLVEAKGITSDRTVLGNTFAGGDFLYADGIRYRLSELIRTSPAEHGLTLANAVDINDRLEISADATYEGNPNTVAVKLTPAQGGTPKVPIPNIEPRTSSFKGSVWVQASPPKRFMTVRYSTGNSPVTRISPRFPGRLKVEGTIQINFRTFDGRGNASPLASILLKELASQQDPYAAPPPFRPGGRGLNYFGSVSFDSGFWLQPQYYPTYLYP